MSRINSITLTSLLALGLAAGPSQADEIIGNLYIDGSLCVGNDCVNGQAFGFDTQILKENNLRLFFDDTSSTATFPNNDWRFALNDTSDGGDDHFSLADATAGRYVFRVFAGARSNALVVDSQ
ncbi:hypothetical protein, partial [Marimonas arenosa]